MNTSRLDILIAKAALLFESAAYLFKQLLIGIVIIFSILAIFKLKAELGIDIFPNYNSPIDDWANQIFGS